jgi:molybdopterin-containing oxidoreductase family membrane subunit
MAPRFLTSAFASGPSLLIIIALILRKFSSFDPGKEAIQKLAKIVAYAIIGTVFFILLEIFTVFYSGVPEHLTHFQYLFVGLDGATKLVPWIWLSIALAIAAIVLLVNPATRKNEKVLFGACVAVFISIWIDKGLGLIIPGFIPSPTGEIFEYWPTVPEVLIMLGVWAVGFLILTILYKIAISVKQEIST